MPSFEHSGLRWVLAATVLAVIVISSVSAGLLGVGALSFAVPEKVDTSNVLLNPSSWNILTVPCPWNGTWCVTDDPPLHKYRILVDLGHAERIKIDGISSSNLDKSSNSRIFDWQDWAKDMRAQGYEVNVLTKKTVSASDLINADLYIVAQPDSGKNGPAYFTADEKEAIACFILRGNTLLVMAQQFMGGKDQTTYNGDLKTTYASADIINDLLEGIHVDGRFTEGKVSGDVLDLMDSKNSGTQVFSGKLPDIWLPAGNLKPEMKSGTFAYFHGLSVEPGTTGWLVRGDSTTFTSPKNSKYSPVVQPEGSLPVAIGVNGLGCGKVYLYGDPSAWQKESYIGKVYSETKYHEQDAARALVSRMLSFNRTCEPCEEQGTAQTTLPVPTVTTTRPRTTVTPSESGDCTSCIEGCKGSYSGSSSAARVGMVDCVAQCPGVDLSGFTTSSGHKVCRSCGAATLGDPTDASGKYANCLEQNSCSCPPTYKNCDTCLSHCGANDAGCYNFCMNQFPNECGCDTCLGLCTTEACDAACRNPDGTTCVSSGSCDTCIQACNDNYPGTDTTSLSNRMTCLNGCYASAVAAKGGSNLIAQKCQYCYDWASTHGGSGTSGIVDAYSQCLADHDCSCPTETCTDCMSWCGANDATCYNTCISRFPKECDCDTCLGQCTTEACRAQCRKSDGSSCSSTTTGDCLTCIDACNSKGLTGDALKTCFSGCGAGLCTTAWTTCNTPTFANVVTTGNFRWVADDGTSTEMASVKKDNENIYGGDTVATVTPGTCYAIAMQTSSCECKDLTFCASRCPVGQNEVIDDDGTYHCVSGTLADDASCSKMCASSVGAVDECSVCRCKQRTVASCTDANCAEGMTASLDANGNCVCTGTALVNPGGTTVQSACLDCYKDCVQSSSTGTSTTATNKFNHLYGTAQTTEEVKSTEIVVNTCQKKCDTTYKTNIVSCACANTQCGEDETPFPQADLSCKCIPKTQLGTLSTGIDLAALQSQWTEHHTGMPTGSSTTGAASCPGCGQRMYQCGTPGNCRCCYYNV